MLVFSTQLCQMLPLYPSLWFNSPPHPLPYVNKYTVYTHAVCNGGGGVWGSGPQTDKHLPQSLFTDNFFEMTTFCIAFYEPYLSISGTYRFPRPGP